MPEMPQTCPSTKTLFIDTQYQHMARGLLPEERRSPGRSRGRRGWRPASVLQRWRKPNTTFVCRFDKSQCRRSTAAGWLCLQQRFGRGQALRVRCAGCSWHRLTKGFGLSKRTARITQSVLAVVYTSGKRVQQAATEGWCIIKVLVYIRADWWMVLVLRPPL